MGNSRGMFDTTVYGRQEQWEDSPEGWRSCTAATDSISARFAMKIDKGDFLATQPRGGLASPPAAPTISAPPPSPPTSTPAT
jgi:hypothetical protein